VLEQAKELFEHAFPMAGMLRRVENHALHNIFTAAFREIMEVLAQKKSELGPGYLDAWLRDPDHHAPDDYNIAGWRYKC